MAIQTPAGCLATNATVCLVFSAALAAAFRVFSAAALIPFALPALAAFAYCFFICCFCQNGKGIACKLRVIVQRLVVLEIHIRLCRRSFCLFRFPVGFELVAAVALFHFPRPILHAFFCQFFGFVRALHAGIVLFYGMYLVMDENTRFLRGAGQRVSVNFASGHGLFPFLKA